MDVDGFRVCQDGSDVAAEAVVVIATPVVVVVVVVVVLVLMDDDLDGAVVFEVFFRWAEYLKSKYPQKTNPYKYYTSENKSADSIQ